MGKYCQTAVRLLTVPRLSAALWALFLSALLGLVLVNPTAQAGQERYEYDQIGRLIRFVDSNNQVTEYSYDAASNLTSVSRGGTASGYVPTLTAISPNFLRRGQTKAITLTGQRLQVGTLQTSDPGLDLGNVRQSASQILADLTVAVTVPTGNQTLTFSNAEGAAALPITVAPELPVLSVEPSPLALPPDNGTRAITLRLSNADVIPHSISLVSSDTSKATVNPANVSIAAGQTSIQVSVTSKAAGFVTLQLTSPTLQTLTVPVYITADFRGVNTSYSAPVGVVVGDLVPAVPQTTATASFNSQRVGIAVGAVLTGVTPKGMTIGATQPLVISGVNIPANVTITVIPSTGTVVDTTAVAANGKQITAQLSLDASAATGPLRVVVTDAAGNVLPFADITQSQIVVTSGQPIISSIEPLFATAGTTMQLKVRGANLQNSVLSINPVTDLRVDSRPVINAEGTELIAYIQIAPLAATGARLVKITTPSGQSSALASVANQFTIVSEIKANITPIFAQPVGIVVGTTTVAAATQSIGPITAPNVGVLVGAAAQTTSPKVGVIGTTITLVVTGQGLQSVQSISLVPADGLITSNFAANNGGTQLSLTIAIDPLAPKTARRIVLNTLAGPLPFARVEDASLLVAAPAPELISTTPQVVKAGSTATFTVRGQNFRDVLAVRFEPAAGLATSLPLALAANADGTVLTVPVQAATNATTGPRTLIIVTAGGESTNVQGPANTVYVAQQVGPTYADISAQPVGILVGTTPTVAAVTSTYTALAPLVGVLVQTVPLQNTASQFIAANNVGVVVGAAIYNASPLSPDGFLKASAGVLTLNGVGLEGVSSVQLTGTNTAGISLGALTSNAQGTQVTVPVNVAAGVASGGYGIVVSSGSGTATTRLGYVGPGALAFSVGALPTTLDSIAPIVLEQGKTYTFTVRGSNLKDVYQIMADPQGGLNFGFDFSALQWSSDALGEKLSIRVLVDPAAAIGSRVIRLKVAGGLTDATATPANTITVVAPQ